MAKRAPLADDDFSGLAVDVDESAPVTGASQFADDDFSGLAVDVSGDPEHSFGETVSDATTQFFEGFNKPVINALSFPSDVVRGGINAIGNLAGAEGDILPYRPELNPITERFLRDTPARTTAGRVAKKAGRTLAVDTPLSAAMLVAAPQLAASNLASAVTRNALPAASSAIGRAGQKVSNFLTGGVRGAAAGIAANPLPSAVGEVIASVGAGTGVGIAQENDVGLPGQALSGIGGAIAPQVLGLTPAAMAVRFFRRRLSSTAQTEQATKRVAKILTEDVDAVPGGRFIESKKLQEQIPGLNLTLPEQAESGRLFDIQRRIGKGLSGAEVAKEIERRSANRAAIIDAKNAAAPQATHDPDNIVTMAGETTDRARKQIDAKTERLTNDEKFIADNISTMGARKRAAGEELRDIVAARRANVKKEMTTLANDLGINDKSSELATGQAFADMKQAYLNAVTLRTADGTAAAKNHDFIKMLDTLSHRMTPDELTSVRSRLSEELEIVTRNPTAGNAGDRRGLSATLKSFDNFLDKIGTQSVVAGNVDKREVEDILGMLDAVKGSAKIQKPESISEFFSRSGGLKDDEGELSNMFGQANLRVGQSNLVQQGGENLDDAARIAGEVGFFPGGRPSKDEFLRALDEDLNQGGFYKAEDSEALAAFREADEVAESLAALGVNAKMSRPEAARAITKALEEEAATAGVGSEDFGKRYRQFRKAYLDKYIVPYERDATRKVLRKGNEHYILRDEQVAGAYFEPGNEKAARQFAGLFANDAEANASIRAFALDDLYTKTASDGNLNLKTVDTWLRKHRSILQYFPGLQRELADTTTALRGMASRRAELRARAKDVEKSALQREINAVEGGGRTPEQFVQRAIENPKRMDDLLATITSDVGRDGLARAVWDNVFRQANAEKYVAEHAASLTKALGGKKFAKARQLLVALRKAESSSAPSGAEASGGESIGFLPSLDSMEKFLGSGLNQISSRIFAVESGRTSARFVFFDMAGRFIRGYSRTQADDILKEAMVNPELAQRLVEGISKKNNVQVMSRLYTYLASIGFVIGDGEDN